MSLRDSWFSGDTESYRELTWREIVDRGGHTGTPWRGALREYSALPGEGTGSNQGT